MLSADLHGPLPTCCVRLSALILASSLVDSFDSSSLACVEDLLTDDLEGQDGTCLQLYS